MKGISTASWILAITSLMVAVVLNAQIADANDPAAELAAFKLAEGFEISLFASEMDGVVKPIQMRWDERGRLWVIGSQTYPQVKPGEEPNDKVWIVEDSNGDGKSDRVTVFADGLMIPTGLEIAPGPEMAVYVGEGTKLWLMTDADDDGKADRREVVLRGFGTGDNHQNLNSFRWSPRGELMFCQGLHAFSRVETIYGIVKLDEAGLWQYRPRERRLDAFFGGAADPQNPWGWTWTEWGQPIVVAGNNGTMFYPAPEMIRGYQNGRRDSIWVNGKSRKTSGPVIVKNSHFPPEWQGVIIVGGYINNAVWALKLEDEGAGFRIMDHPTLPPLVQSSHGSFRPVDVKFGPDGALYICDWYNPIIGHYQASFRHPDRDKGHGRIWRVAWKGDSSPGRVASVRAGEKASAAEIESMLERIVRGAGNYERENLQRVLFGMETKTVVPVLRSWYEKRDAARADHDLAMVTALGIFEAHDVAEPRLLQSVLGAKEANARAFAASTLGHWADRLPNDFDVRGAVEKLAEDDHPRVRMTAAVAAGNINAPWKEEALAKVAAQPRDRFIDVALEAAKNAKKSGAVDERSKPGTIVTTSKFEPIVAAAGRIRATREFVATLAKEVSEKGNAQRGAEIFRRANLTCTVCHRVGETGGVIGPSLDAIGSAQPLDFIVGAVLEPQHEVKEGFETYVYTLKDGRTVIGTRVAGTADRFTVRDPAGTEVIISSADISERKYAGSLMPAGLVDGLNPEELRDLFAYLAQLGKAQTPAK